MLTMLGFFGPTLLVTIIVGLSGADNQTISMDDFREFDEQGREIDYEGRYMSPQ